MEPRVLFSGTSALALGGGTYGVTATVISGTEIILNWTPLGQGETGYIVTESVGSNSQPVAVVSVPDANAGTFLAEGLAVQTSYTFSVTPVQDAVPLDSLGSATATTYVRGMTGWYTVTTTTQDSESNSPTVEAQRVFAGSKRGAAFKAANSDHSDYQDYQAPGTARSSVRIQTSVTSVASDYGGGGGTVVPCASGVPTANTPAAPGTGAADLPPNASTDPVRYLDGAVEYYETDLLSNALGTPWGQTRSWSQSTAFASNLNGNGWDVSILPQIKSLSSTQLAVVFSGTEQSVFNLTNGTWLPSSFLANTLTSITLPNPAGSGNVNGFECADTTGQQYAFYGVGSDVATVFRGQLYNATDPAGNVTTTAYNSAGQLVSLSRNNLTGTGSSQNGIVVSLNYAYLGTGDPNAGKISGVTLTEQRVINGVGQTPIVASHVVYTYYQGTYTGADQFGNLGDLETATTLDSAELTIDQTYYRYYTPYNSSNNGNVVGYAGGLQYIFGPSAVVRLQQAFTSPFQASNAQLAPYATQEFQYNCNDEVSQHAVAGMSDTPTGGETAPGTYTYTYGVNAYFPTTASNNDWAFVTIESDPAENQNYVYMNEAGQVLMNIRHDSVDHGTPNNQNSSWIMAYQYNSAGQLIETISPSAINNCDNTLPDLGISEGYVHTNTGLIQKIVYAATTMATLSSAGSVAGYISAEYIQQGSAGGANEVEQDAFTYIKHQDAQGNAVYVRTASTIYQNSDGTGAETTTDTYGWLSGTNQIASDAESLPTVSTSHNGPGSGTASVTNIVYDQYGRPVWTMDANGHIDYMGYDAATGAVVQFIQDVNTNNVPNLVNDEVPLPSWTSPNGTGLNLVTTYTVDSLGRTILETSPAGRATYTLYGDADQAVLVATGASETLDVNGDGTLTATGPIYLVRNRIPYSYTGGSTTYAGVYDETITFSGALSVVNNVVQFPTFNANGTVNLIGNGSTSLPQFTIQTLSRSLHDASYAVVEADAYFQINNTTYLGQTAGSPYAGSMNVNYYATLFGYDVAGRQYRTIDANGTITDVVYDALGRAVSTWVGTDDSFSTGSYFYGANAATTSNMIKVSTNVYDNGGEGDGNLTQTTQYPNDGTANRVTQHLYDWRDRQIASKTGVQSTESGNTSFITFAKLDNLGDVTATYSYAADGVSMATFALGTYDSFGDLAAPNISSNALRAYATTEYDDDGRAFRTTTFSVNPDDGTISSTGIVSNTWYDLCGDIIGTQTSGGAATKMSYDGASREVMTYTTDGGVVNNVAPTWFTAGTVTNDIVLEQTATAYDADGNVIETADAQRFNTDPAGATTSGTGALFTDSINSDGSLVVTPSSSGNLASRIYFTATYYDPAGREVANVNVGNNGGTPWSRLSSAPTTSSSTVLVTQYGYNAAGLIETVTDPKGIVTKTIYDNLGRTLYSIAAWTTGFDPTSTLPSSDSEDQTTRYAYDGDGNTLSMTALRPSNEASETTAYVYGGFGSGAAVQSNDLLRLVEYPIPSSGEANSGSPQNSFTYNALGEILTKTDQNGTTHTYSYDVLGRQILDSVNIPTGSNVDRTILAIGTTYNSQGLVYKITSYTTAAADSNSIANEVLNEYNGFGQLTQQYQSHAGQVFTTGANITPHVDYAYSDPSEGSRLVSMTYPVSTTYPDGRILHYGYDDNTLDNAISRLSYLADDDGNGDVGQQLESYQYLGLSTVVVRSQPQTGIELTYIKLTGESNGYAGDQYTGLDRFGRVVDQRWIDSSGADVERYQYVYDLDSNVTAKYNLINASLNETYDYDALNRLTSMTRGGAAYQSWGLDAVGNMNTITTGEVIQTNSFNAQNGQETAGGWNLTTDSNGNTTSDDHNQRLVYDAWNRLVAVRDNNDVTYFSYAYDGIGRRIAVTPLYGNPTDMYYDANWQDIQDSIRQPAMSLMSCTTQYVWSPVYVDAILLRDVSFTIDDIWGRYQLTLADRVYALQDANYNVTALVTLHTIDGDANGDGQVDDTDLLALGDFYGYDAGGGDLVGDFNHDGYEDEDDFMILFANYGQTATSATWRVTERFVYDAYGNSTTYVLNYDDGAWDTWSQGNEYLAWNYEYQGGRYDVATGLYDFRNRDYSPTLMRWMEQDPAGYPASGENLYNFCGGGPVDNMDPMGLTTYSWGPGMVPGTGYYDWYLRKYGVPPTVAAPSAAPPTPPTAIVEPAPTTEPSPCTAPAPTTTLADAMLGDLIRSMRAIINGLASANGAATAPAPGGALAGTTPVISPPSSESQYRRRPETPEGKIERGTETVTSVVGGLGIVPFADVPGIFAKIAGVTPEIARSNRAGECIYNGINPWDDPYWNILDKYCQGVVRLTQAEHDRLMRAAHGERQPFGE